MDKKAKLSDQFTYYELTRSDTAERKGLDNTPPEDLYSVTCCHLEQNCQATRKLSV